MWEKGILITAVIWIVGLVGCNQGPYPDAKGVFPAELVGVWEAERPRKPKWGIKLEPDGSISKIIHSVAGPINIAEGGSHYEGPHEGTYAVYLVKEPEVEYYPNKRLLKVKINLEHFEMKLPNGILRGHITDYFEGTVSKDARTWEVKWRSRPFLENAKVPDPDIIDANPEPLTFRKLDLDKISEQIEK